VYLCILKTVSSALIVYDQLRSVYIATYRAIFADLFIYVLLHIQYQLFVKQFFSNIAVQLTVNMSHLFLEHLLSDTTLMKAIIMKEIQLNNDKVFKRLLTNGKSKI
jgi:hypothetical protein